MNKPSKKRASRRAIVWERREGDSYSIEVGGRIYPDIRAEDVEVAVKEYYDQYGHVQVADE